MRQAQDQPLRRVPGNAAQGANGVFKTDYRRINTDDVGEQARGVVHVDDKLEKQAVYDQHMSVVSELPSLPLSGG